MARICAHSGIPIKINYYNVKWLSLWRWQNRQWHSNVPCLPSVWIAMAARWCNTKHITQCSMSRATLEATGCRHWATTCSVLPQRPPGQQQTKRWQINVPEWLAISMAVAVRRYDTARINRWRRFKHLLETTKRRHRASIAANRRNRSRICWFSTRFLSSNCKKRSQV